MQSPNPSPTLGASAHHPRPKMTRKRSHSFPASASEFSTLRELFEEIDSVDDRFPPFPRLEWPGEQNKEDPFQHVSSKASPPSVVLRKCSSEPDSSLPSPPSDRQESDRPRKRSKAMVRSKAFSGLSDGVPQKEAVISSDAAPPLCADTAESFTKATLVTGR